MDDDVRAGHVEPWALCMYCPACRLGRAVGLVVAIIELGLFLR